MSSSKFSDRSNGTNNYPRTTGKRTNSSTPGPSRFGDPIPKRAVLVTNADERCEVCAREHVTASLRRQGFCEDCNTSRCVCAECINKNAKFTCMPCQKDASLPLDKPVECTTCGFKLRRIYWKTNDSSHERVFCSLCSKNPETGQCVIVRNLPPPPKKSEPLPNIKFTVTNDRVNDSSLDFFNIAERALMDKLIRVEDKLDAVLRALKANKQNGRSDDEREEGETRKATSSVTPTVQKDMNDLFGDPDLQADYD